MLLLAAADKFQKQEAFLDSSTQMWCPPPDPYLSLYTHLSCWLPGPCLGLSSHDLLVTLPGREDLCPGKKERPSCRRSQQNVTSSQRPSCPSGLEAVLSLPARSSFLSSSYYGLQLGVFVQPARLETPRRLSLCFALSWRLAVDQWKLEVSGAQTLRAPPRANLPRTLPTATEAPEHQPVRRLSVQQPAPGQQASEGTVRAGPQLARCLPPAEGPMPGEQS
ncbi:uncharacterized protein LOC116624297 isoform X2 [Phoca vitulina]|uniref:uncharacterized protein LOC116624297 isoform X2 n=1 Tax=Phoca vitulina TaxID=9720 RepID=UPI001395FF3C|nr:uncharacterized protein LOC116624297 isoform X2 [Phoca vitulina]